jgi:hypothetical protein
MLEVVTVARLPTPMATVPAKKTERVESWESRANPLPDYQIGRNLIRRNTPASGTRHTLRYVVPAGVDKAVDVLKKTDGAIAFRNRAIHCVRDPTVRRSRRLSRRDRCLSPIGESQHNERPSGVH